MIDGFCAQVGAADGSVGPALLLDPDFLAALCNAIGHLNRSDLMTRLGGAASAAAARQEREQMERERQERERLEQERQERERLELERQERERQRRLQRETQRVQADRWATTVPSNIHGLSTERVQGLQRSVAESLGLGPVFRDPLKDGSEGPEMVLIPLGSFLMGASESDGQASNDEKPQHRVSIARPFAIGSYAVTFDEYDRFCAATRREKPDEWGWGRGRRPAINVSWDDAVACAAWLSEQTGRHYRLPTEAEWEYAARAGTATRWSFGDNEGALGDYAWFWGNSDSKTHPVGEKQPNPWGLYDIHGNVWEWVQDRYHGNYAGAPADGAERSESCRTADRVVRGGAWNNQPTWLRSAYRLGLGPSYRSSNLGFRLAQDL